MFPCEAVVPHMVCVRPGSTGPRCCWNSANELLLGPQTRPNQGAATECKEIGLPECGYAQALEARSKAKVARPQARCRLAWSACGTNWGACPMRVDRFRP